MSDAPIEDAARAYGTPFYLFDERVLYRNYRRIADAFEAVIPDLLVAYSYKTNYLPAICRRVGEWGGGAEVVCGMELELALALGTSPRKIVYNAPAKDPWSLRRAVEQGLLLINVETLDECRELSRYAGELGREASVGVRVRPEVTAHVSRDPSYTGLSGQTLGKFGWPIATGEAGEFCKEVASIPRLRLTGLHFHVGQRVMRVEPYLEALGQVCELAGELRAAGNEISMLDLGGGFAPPGLPNDLSGPIGKAATFLGLCDRKRFYEEMAAPFPFGALAAGVADTLARYGRRNGTVILEPGRSVVQDAMGLVTAVRGIKRTRDRTWVFVDTGMNHLPQAEAGAPGYPIRPVRESDAPSVPCAVAGPLCHPSDHFAADLPLPADLAPGDLLLISNAGAYSLSRSFAFGSCRIPVVTWDGASLDLCWERETWEDVFRFDPDLRHQALFQGGTGSNGHFPHPVDDSEQDASGRKVPRPEGANRR